MLTLYESEAFANFTYWSAHLFLYTEDTLQKLLAEAGFKSVAIRQFQRYPLANHLYWLAKEKPGGQMQWNGLNSPVLDGAYAETLGRLKKCDTIIGTFTV